MKASRQTAVQLVRYAVVGGIAFVVDYGSLYLLTEFAGLNHLLSAAIAFTLGLATNYALSISWVFRDSRRSHGAVEFSVFALVGIVGLGLNEVVIWLGTDVLGFHYMLSKIVSTALVFFWNFFGRKILLFSK